MKIEVADAIRLGSVVKDDKDYVGIMVNGLNVSYDKSMSKSKVCDKYKAGIFQKYGKPEKYPCLVVCYNDDQNNIVAEFFYKNELVNYQKSVKATLKEIDSIVSQISPSKKKDSYRFL